MNLGHLAYLITIVIFAGGAVLIEWSLACKDLKKFGKVIIGVSVFAIAATLIAEPIALRWECWRYNAQRIFNMFFGGAALETYLFAILVTLAVASATLIWSGWEDENLPLVKTTFNKLKKKLKKF